MFKYNSPGVMSISLQLKINESMYVFIIVGTDFDL